MSRILMIVIALLGAPARAVGEPLSLAQARKLLTESPRARASRSAVLESTAQKDMSRGMFYPTLLFKEGYSLTNDPVGVFSAKLQQGRFAASDFAVPALNDPGAVSHWRTRFELQQPIFHSRTDVRNYEAARLKTDAENARHTARVQELRLQVSRLYFTAAALKERRKSVEEGIALLQKLEGSYQLMSAPTAATTTNYLIAQSVRLNLQAQKSGLTAGESNASRQMASLVGLPSDPALELSDPLPAAVAAASSPGTEPRARPDVLAAEKESEAAVQAVGSATADWGPRLDAVAGYNLYTGRWDDFNSAYDVGVQLTWPIFEGPRFGRIDASRARSVSAREYARAVRQEADASFRNAEADLKARADEYGLLKSAESKAGEAFNLARKRYAQGILSLFDYSQSIQNWVALRQELVEARKRVAEASAQLSYERGEL